MSEDKVPSECYLCTLAAVECELAAFEVADGGGDGPIVEPSNPDILRLRSDDQRACMEIGA
jgi:hypothetical protein